MAEPPEHSHCKFCGDPIPFDEKYCSEECGTLFAARAKKESRKETTFFVLAMVAVTVLSIVLYFLR